MNSADQTTIDNAHSLFDRRISPVSAVSHLGRIVALGVMLQGCAGQVSRQDAANFDGLLAHGDYPQAAQMAMASGKIAPDGTSNNLAWSLNAGAALIYAGDSRTAIPVLDGAENLMKARDLDGFSNTQYNYATYDGIMANTYKALGYLTVGDRANARVEFNRVGGRQAMAEEQFSKQKEKLDADVKKKSAGQFDLTTAMTNAQNSKEFQAEQLTFGAYANYRPFINPAASYLTAVFLLNNAETGSDFERARVELQRVRDMVGPSPVIDADLKLVKSGKKSPPAIWIVFESGQAPTFSQYNITFPVPIVGKASYISTVTVAMPRMMFHAMASGGITASATGDQAKTVSVGSFDRVMATEFSRRYQGILARAVAEAALKVGVQYAAAQTNNSLLMLTAAIASNISTADTRSWTALPKEFQAARLKMPADGTVRLQGDDGMDFGTVKVPVDRSSIIYIKETMHGGRPSTQVFPL